MKRGRERWKKGEKERRRCFGEQSPIFNESVERTISAYSGRICPLLKGSSCRRVLQDYRGRGESDPVIPWPYIREKVGRGEEEEDEKKIPIIAGRKISTVNSLDLLIAHRSTRHIGFPVVFSPFVLFCRSKFLFLSYFRSRLYVRLSFVRSRSFTLPLSD